MTSSPASDAPGVLVAVAWPYANGPLHLGHIAGSLLPPDVFARYQRLRGRRVIMVSGSDMHGTPITVAAEKEGIAPEALAARNKALHDEALAALDIQFDCFTSTATANHRDVVHDIFRGLLKNGFIEKRTMTAPFDPQAERFLPDRYVEGECPHCGFADARGDQCDDCGRTLDPQDLKKPRSKFTGATPEYRETDHYFLLLSKLAPDLKAWVDTQADAGAWRATVRNFTENWLKEGLQDRAITRDMTYGVPIPSDVGAYPDKRIYVWFEAVIGYRSAPVEWAAGGNSADAWQPYWRAAHQPEQYYFLGKDNIPFHTIIWPAMIIGYNKGRPAAEQLALPTDVPANEFLQFAGAKFSKSRGNAFYVLDLLQHFDADQARYYLAANMPERGDTDWTWPDFVAKVNDELVATLGNYVNRVVAFTHKQFDGAAPDADVALAAAIQPGHADHVAAIETALAQAATELQSRSFKAALRNIMDIARAGNVAVNDLAPWKLIKEDKARAGAALLWHLGVVKTLAVALAPFLPRLAESLWTQLGEAGPGPRALSETMHAGDDAWPTTVLAVAPGQRFGAVAPLVRKLDLKAVEAEFTAQTDAPKEDPAVADETPTATYDDFAKLDLRVGVVTSVEEHPKADKLYVLKVDLGTEERQILAGLREFVTADELAGRRVVVIANLAPRKIRGLESQGMILAAEEGDVVTPLTPAKDVPPGAKVR